MQPRHALLLALLLTVCSLLLVVIIDHQRHGPEDAPGDPSALPMKYQDCNVVLVSFDALQAAHVGCLGNPRDVTPTLDRLASSSFNFTHAYSVASWTVPASMTWFTGVYPSEHGMTNKFAVYAPPLVRTAKLRERAPKVVTLAEIMRQNGYITGGFTGNAGVSGGFGYEQGFDVYYFEKGRFGGLNRSAARAIDWLKDNPGKKFFLFLHGYDVHGQYAPAAGYDYRYVASNYDNRYRGSPQEQEVLREEGLDKGQLTLRDADVEFWRAVYDEKIAGADARFQVFLRELDRLGLTETTLFVVTSDHGTEFYEHRRFDHGFTLYNEMLHVPLLIKLPGQRAGKVIADRISSIDIMPTILDLTGVQIPDEADRQLRGTSLVSTLQGEPAGRDVFAETDYREYTYKRSIITAAGWKLIVTLETMSRELYDLKTDPGELKNLERVESKLADELQQKLFAHFKAIGHDLASKRWIPGFNPVYTFPSD